MKIIAQNGRDSTTRLVMIELDVTLFEVAEALENYEFICLRDMEKGNVGF